MITVIMFDLDIRVARMVFNDLQWHCNLKAIKSEELANLSPSSPVLLIRYGSWQGRGQVVRWMEHIQR